MSELISVTNLYKSYWQDGKEVPVLKHIHFSMQRGQMISVEGASGAGKSTLLHIMGAIDRPTKGDVVFENASIFQKTDEQLAVFRNRKIGFVFQFHHLLPEFSALENVMMPALIAGESQKTAAARAKEKLEEVGLFHRMDHRPGELSGGEQQRVAMARALVLNPPLLLADEPTGNLDTKTGDRMLDLLQTLNEKHHIAVVLVTHNQLLAKRMPVRMLIEDGALISSLQR